MPLCGIDWWDKLIEKRDVVDYRYLTSIWTIRLFSRYCDICKDFRLEIPFSTTSLRQCGGQFGKLTQIQRSVLDYFINDNTISEA